MKALSPLPCAAAPRCSGAVRAGSIRSRTTPCQLQRLTPRKRVASAPGLDKALTGIERPRSRVLAVDFEKKPLRRRLPRMIEQDRGDTRPLARNRDNELIQNMRRRIYGHEPCDVSCILIDADQNALVLGE